MLKQNKLFRSHALGSFERAAARRDPRPGDAALAERHRQLEGCAERELRARDDGALHARRRPRAYTERDVREQARALTGFRNDWKQGLGDDNFHFDPRAHDTGMKSVFGKSGRSTGSDACHLCVAHPTHPSFFVSQALELLRAGRAGSRDAARARSALPRRLPGAARAPGDPAAPGALHRAADGEASGRPRRRAAAPDRAGITTTDWVVDRRRSPASSSSTRRTSPAGTTRAGSTPRRTAAAGSPCSGSCRTASSIPPRARQTPDAQTRARRRRSPSGTTRPLTRARRTRRCCTSRARRSPTPASSAGSRCSTRCCSRTRCAS